MDDSDARRRRNEMNMFSAMALGGGDIAIDDASHTDNDSNDIDSDTISKNLFDSGSMQIPPSAFPFNNEEARMRDEISAFAAAAGGDPSSLQDVFSQAVPQQQGDSSVVLDSGTFATSEIASLTPAQKVSEQSNLDKAAAALAIGFDDSDDEEDGKAEAGIGGMASSLPVPVASSANSRQQKMKQDYPMYNEAVRMPRPLFFGPILPPRVLNEARRIVKEALEDVGYTGLGLEEGEFKHSQQQSLALEGNLPKLSSLPPEVQNIVGALRVHGHGLSAYPFDDDRSAKEEEADNVKPFWQGTSYVSTYQPVFGETARMYRQHQGILPASVQQVHDDNKQTDENENPSSPQPTAGSAIDPSNKDHGQICNPSEVNRYSQEEANKAFLANISSEAASNPQEHSTATAKKKHPDAVETSKEINMFSMWARGEGSAEAESDNSSQGDCSDDSFGSATVENIEAVKKEVHALHPTARGLEPAQNSSIDLDSSNAKGTPPLPMSDQDLFSQWARGESLGHKGGNDTFSADTLASTFVMREKSKRKKTPPPRFGFESDAAGTFQRVPATNLDDSDDDSIVGSELKKKVGVNEHLDKALASLVDDGPLAQTDLDEENSNLQQVMRATPGGRPFSNIELTNGCVPIFGIDDAPLPVEGDLGIHETKNDEQRTLDLKRSQEVIDKYVGPHVFGPVACPNPATSPDDNHSWNSRSAPSQRHMVAPTVGVTGGGGNQSDRVGVLPVPTDAAPSPKPPPAPNRKSARNQSPRVRNRNQPTAPTSRKNSKLHAPSNQPKRGRFPTRQVRYGWWSIPEDFDETGKGGGMSSDMSVVSGSEQSSNSTLENTTEVSSAEDPLQLPPLYHASQNVHIDTRLHPGPENLKEENLPLSDLHSATSMALELPYLSDRPPSYRYLQIDTHSVGFIPLGGEVEPLFCSLAIYNVETIPGHSHSPTPMPDLQRCGRVTEALNFDVVSDQEVEARCIGSLWPFFTSSTMTPQASKTGTSTQTPTTNAAMSSNPSLQGTRCGVFPLPSNLNVGNLYAVLIVQKVLSEDSAFEIYLKQSKASKAAGGIDIDKFRAKAEKASNEHGSFLMPFAFGVAPLLQVFGADNPFVASSRAVQIPLFRFSAGQGDRQIIDHIMVMLYPR
jgi:hypothetical protein